MLEIGDQMPEFMLRNAAREEVTEAYFDGAIAIVAFYPMAFTGG